MSIWANARRMQAKGTCGFALLLLLIVGIISGMVLPTVMVTYIMEQQVYGYTAAKGTVLCKSGMVRKDASTTASFAFGVVKDETVTITDEKKGSDGNTWYQISVSGSTGYIRADLVKKSETAASTTLTTASGGTVTAISASTASGTVKGANVIVREEASKTAGIRSPSGRIPV